MGRAVEKNRLENLKFYYLNRKMGVGLRHKRDQTRSVEKSKRGAAGQ